MSSTAILTNITWLKLPSSGILRKQIFHILRLPASVVEPPQDICNKLSFYTIIRLFFPSTQFFRLNGDDLSYQGVEKRYRYCLLTKKLLSLYNWMWRSFFSIEQESVCLKRYMSPCLILLLTVYTIHIGVHCAIKSKLKTCHSYFIP